MFKALISSPYLDSYYHFQLLINIGGTIMAKLYRDTFRRDKINDNTNDNTNNSINNVIINTGSL